MFQPLGGHLQAYKIWYHTRYTEVPCTIPPYFISLKMTPKGLKHVALTFCWPCISVYLSQYLTNLTHKICVTISFISYLCMFRAHALIIRRSKLHYTASGIITLYKYNTYTNCLEVKIKKKIICEQSGGCHFAHTRLADGI